jgi:hypothetical protein
MAGVELTDALNDLGNTFVLTEVYLAVKKGILNYLRTLLN